MSIFEEIDIEAVDVLDEEAPLGIELPKREEEEWEEEAPVAEEPTTGDTSDPVRMYLQEMGNIPLLSREEEVSIAKEIEAGEKRSSGNYFLLLRVAFRVTQVETQAGRHRTSPVLATMKKKLTPPARRSAS